MYFFERYLGHKLPKHTHRLFRTLEHYRQHGYCRPILIIERGDQDLRPLLEKYIEYRIAVYGLHSITVADERLMYKTENHIPRRRRIKKGSKQAPKHSRLSWLR